MAEQNETNNFEADLYHASAADTLDYMKSMANVLMAAAKLPPDVQVKQNNAVHIADSMIADIPGDEHLKRVTVGLMDGNGKKAVGTVTVSDEDMDPDWDTVSLPEAQRATYVMFNSGSNYIFSENGGDTREISGAGIVKQCNAYMRNMKEMAEKRTKEAQAAQKKPTNLLRVNDSMIKDTRQDGLKAVTIGLMDADGNKKVGTIFVGAKQVNADKKTTELPKKQQKSYVALDRNKDYTFSVRGPKGEDGKPVYENFKVSGADIIEQNKAYMKDKAAQRTKSLEESVEKAPEAQAEAEAGA